MSEPRTSGTLTPEEFKRARDIFESALARPVGERRAFAERACDGNTRLIAEIEQMLAGHQSPHALFDRAIPPESAFTDWRRGDMAGAGSRAASSCSTCVAPLAPTDRFCRSCGSPTTSTASGEEGRFRAGALFAGRFRIVAALGRGGMGEVYRAHDLELGQPVALKFLTSWRSDERARTRLRREVRLARQIAHPNVCRVYDIGEAQGDLYLTMEYIDGEDLAALLTRIGRVPADKGVEIARKLCAGLAAAHARGVLHRDFKPANIMIDGRGEVRIMDFGLAATAEHLETAEVRSGTPAYMAPEQLSGREATPKSDLYALGLVLYELFTGRIPFPVHDLHELQRHRASRPSTTPSTLIPDLGPQVERAILRCLEPDPALRPGSALEVSATLPGGDPLAEALAAGETPSPEMVAAAGSNEALRPAVALALLACIGAGLTAAVLLAERAQVLGRLPLNYPPEVLTQKARDIVQSVGHDWRPADTASGFRGEDGWLQSVAAAMPLEASRADWDRRLAVAPHPVSFWYLQSDAPLVPRATAGRVEFQQRVSTARNVELKLGLDGGLLMFRASQPGAGAPPGQGSRRPGWPDFFEAAHLPASAFMRVDPDTPSTATSEIRLAWEGPDPRLTGTSVRVEARERNGQPVAFEVVSPWAKTTPAPALPPASEPLPITVLSLALLACAWFFAYRNVKAGRSDIRGALIVAVFALASGEASRRLRAHEPFGDTGAQAFLFGITAGLWYLAFEPWVRRRWPQALVTSSRALAGRWRDPVVARDILVGLLAGLAISCARHALYLAFTPVGSLRGGTFQLALDQLMGTRFVAATVLFAASDAIRVGLVMFFLLFVCRVILRKPTLATIGYFALMSAWAVPDFIQGNWIGGCINLLINGASVLIMIRFGLLAVTAWAFFGKLIDYGIVTTHVGDWYGESSLVVMVIVSGAAMWACRTSLGNRPLISPPPAAG